MKYKPTPLFYVFIGLCLFWGLVGYACACGPDKDDLTDITLKTHVPTTKGWDKR